MSGFRFKQFYVAHSQCAMKVGTDGILLGAWAPLYDQDGTPCHNVLDIGSGSGLVALMLAQRSDASCQIDAVEIDPDAAAQSRDNISHSPWANRIHVHAMPLQNYRPNQPLDLIVSNPPYFHAGQRLASEARARARHRTSLDAGDLLQFAQFHLTESGRVALIIPHSESDYWRKTAQHHGLFLTHRVAVKPTPNKAVLRELLAFSKQGVADIELDELVIRDEQNRYTKAWAELTHTFYLNL